MNIAKYIRQCWRWWNGLPPDQQAKLKKTGKTVAELLRDKARKK